MKINQLFQILLIICGISLMVSCEYSWIVQPTVPPPNPDDTISFANQVVPVFTTDTKCTSSSCHGTGGVSPDLTPSKAYNSIVPTLVDLDNPEASIIYQFPHPSSSTHIWEKYTDTEVQTVLIWIQQGALNN